jgi:hypothetical protein
MSARSSGLGSSRLAIHPAQVAIDGVACVAERLVCDALLDAFVREVVQDVRVWVPQFDRAGRGAHSLTIGPAWQRTIGNRGCEQPCFIGISRARRDPIYGVAP